MKIYDGQAVKEFLDERFPDVKVTIHPVECDECSKETFEMIKFGNDTGANRYVCKNCLQKALNMFKE